MTIASDNRLKYPYSIILCISYRCCIHAYNHAASSACMSKAYYCDDSFILKVYHNDAHAVQNLLTCRTGIGGSYNCKVLQCHHYPCNALIISTKRFL